jgi:hypothetical protein
MRWLPPTFCGAGGVAGAFFITHRTTQIIQRADPEGRRTFSAVLPIQSPRLASRGRASDARQAPPIPPPGTRGSPPGGPRVQINRDEGRVASSEGSHPSFRDRSFEKTDFSGVSSATLSKKSRDEIGEAHGRPSASAMSINSLPRVTPWGAAGSNRCFRDRTFGSRGFTSLCSSARFRRDRGKFGMSATPLACRQIAAPRLVTPTTFC